ncbi:hypothetical protein [Edaphobacter acidisoli]|nr:hypothetical protein [Edaphobacter acidisoli]
MSELPRKPGPSLLSIALILGIFFLLVFVVSVLILPDHGKSLLKLTCVSVEPLHALTAIALLN